MSTKKVNALDHFFRKQREGTVILSNRDSTRSSSVIVNDSGVAVVSSNTINGVVVSNDGVTLQGSIFFSGQGTTIKKANYTENPDSEKVFTYPETLYFESAAKEAAYIATGESIGANVSDYGGDGFMPIITDIGGGGGIPHVHTITMKHVHRLEPAYLYRLPGFVRLLTGFMGGFTDFLST
jgi:hypothetical protein